MTNQLSKSEIFKIAHKLAREDAAFDATLPAAMHHSYAYYFRLQLLNVQAIERDSHAELVVGFQVVEPRRLWA